MRFADGRTGSRMVGIIPLPGFFFEDGKGAAHFL